MTCYFGKHKKFKQYQIFLESHVIPSLTSEQKILCYIQIVVSFNSPAIAGRRLKRQKRGNLTPETSNVHNIKSRLKLAHTLFVNTMKKTNRVICNKKKLNDCL